MTDLHLAVRVLVDTAALTHAGMSSTDRAACGTRDDLVRLTVGCEAFEDLQEDLANALAAAEPAAAGTTDAPPRAPTGA